GSLLGVLLGQRGYAVDLYERRPQDTGNDGDSGRSINLALSRRGIEALRLAGLMEEVEPLLIPMEGRMLHLKDGRSQFSSYGQRENEVIYSISRRDLNRLLVERAVAATEVNVLFERKCEQIDFKNKTIKFDQQQQPFDLLIGCDGAGSQVRRSLMEQVEGRSSSDFLDHDYKELEIPAKEDGSFRLEKNALHIWPRGNFMLIALPNLDGSFTVTLFLPKQGALSFESLDSEKAVRKFFEDVFPTAAAAMPELVQDFFDHPAGRLGTVRCQPWHFEDCGLILGDAAHAIVPFHGQGMNAAFEDCSELIRLLDAHDEDWGTVNQQFTTTRKPNADAIAEMALENYTTMRSTVTDPKYALKKEIGFELERRYPDKFIPRYSMVMFHTMPYAEAFSAGIQQQSILQQLTQTVDRLEEVDWEFAHRLINDEG
ncbi:FAD-dependent monooxygenase, partial [bacterium]|nr:FAD-dependent monooxygenase [bacterium]